ncbi:unnamed protein product [Diamesa serratosioi]
MWTSEKDNKFLLIPQTAIIKNIVYEILRECDKRNFVCEKKFVTFLVHLLSLNGSKNGMDFNETFDRTSVEELIDKCLKYIIDSNDTPMNITLKMQVFFIENSNDFDDIIKDHCENVNKKMNILVKEITDVDIKNKEELIIMQKKIIIDIILQTALGSPSNQEIIAEATAALSSVMTEKDVESFAELDSVERLESLKEIRLIVCGIILFNKDTGIGNAIDIPDLPKTLLKSFNTIESLLQFTLCDIMDRVNILTTAFECSICISRTKTTTKSTTTNQLTINVQETKEGTVLEEGEMNSMKDLLILNRQHEIYVRKVLSNLKSVKVKIENHVKNYGEKLFKLHDIVQYRSAVPSIQIFPKFKELAEEWMMLHNLSFILSHQSQINNYMQHLSQLCQQQQYDAIVYKLLAEHPVQTDHDRLNKNQQSNKPQSKLQLNCFSSNLSIVQPPQSNTEIEYLGFCSFILAESKILIPSIPEMGVVLWQNKKLFAFYSLEAAELFIAKPDKCIKKVLESLKSNIQLIMFFNIYNDIKKQTNNWIVNVNSKDNSFATNKDTRSQVDKEIQTEIHPIASNIDQQNVSNLWDYRRKAIELANLRRKKTTSAQTTMSYHKLEIGMQSVELRQKELQTNSNKEINTN